MRPRVRTARRHTLMCFVWECDCGTASTTYTDHQHAIADATRHVAWCDENTHEETSC